MSKFEELQTQKVKHATEMADSLVRMTPYLYMFKQMKEEEKISEWARKYVAAARRLLKLIEDQEALCPRGTMCSGLLVQEINALKGSRGVIGHLERVSTGAEEPDIEKIREALRMIVSREHSLPNLLKMESVASAA